MSSLEETEVQRLREEVRHLRGLFADREKEASVLANIQALVCPPQVGETTADPLPSLTERTEVEKALQVSEERFHLLADNISQFAWMTDKTGEIFWYNRRWFEFTGTTLEAMKGWGWQSVHHPDHVERVVEKFRHALEVGEAWEDTFPLRGKEGLYHWFLSRAMPVRDRTGQIVYWFGTNTDITEQRDAQSQIEALNARLQRAMTETHHRVKNNLQLVSALIDLQRLSGKAGVPMSELERLGANVRALGGIHDLLTQEAKAGSDQETLSGQEVLERLIEVLRQTIGDRVLKSSFDDVRLTGKQSTALTLVTNELISNALKHGKGEIEIDFRVKDNLATLEVCDDGPGFGEGFNVETASHTGLELVEQMVTWDLGGRLAYQNRSEGGARVSVTFPIKNETNATEKAPEDCLPE